MIRLGRDRLCAIEGLNPALLLHTHLGPRTATPVRGGIAQGLLQGKTFDELMSRDTEEELCR